MSHEEEIVMREEAARHLFRWEYFQQFLKIRDKKGEIVPFVMNPVQQKFDMVIRYAQSQRRLLRFIVLKARQMGISTYCEGFFFHRNYTTPQKKTVIIGHLKDAADNMFGMTNRYYDNLPDEIRIKKERSNEKKIIFSGLGNEIAIASAEGGAGVKRSDTIHDLHATEVAFWRDAKETMLALLQTVPEEENTMVVVESTANGIGGWFYNTWQAAVNLENDFIPVFFAWFDDPTYTRPFDTELLKSRFEGTLNDYERTIMKKFNLTLEQLNWRRHMIANKADGDIDKFKQEYPATPEEAFIASGRPVFPVNIVMNNYTSSNEPEAVGDLELIYDPLDADAKPAVKFIENPKGFIKFYEHPDKLFISEDENNRFAGGYDVAEGLEQGDYSVGTILDRKDMYKPKTIMEWHGHIDPDLFAEEIYKIHLFLKKKAYHAIEYNNHGGTTNVNAYKRGVALYFREDFSKGYEISRDMIGFKTSSATKPPLIDDLNRFIRDGLLEDNGKEFWGECLTFVKNSKGSMSAQGKDSDPSTKCFDDRVMSRAIALRCHLWMPNYIMKKEDSRPKWLQRITGGKKTARRRGSMGA